MPPKKGATGAAPPAERKPQPTLPNPKVKPAYAKCDIYYDNTNVEEKLPFEDFACHLNESGFLHSLTVSLCKLYEASERPEDPTEWMKDLLTEHLEDPNAKLTPEEKLSMKLKQKYTDTKETLDGGLSVMKEVYDEVTASSEGKLSKDQLADALERINDPLAIEHAAMAIEEEGVVSYDEYIRTVCRSFGDRPAPESAQSEEVVETQEQGGEAPAEEGEEGAEE